LGSVTVSLKCHPETRSQVVRSVRVVSFRNAQGLWVKFHVEAETDLLMIPPGEKPCRTDGLWKHTCFELFVRTGRASYREFNFAPSGHWAAYQFEDYRKGQSELPIEGYPPNITTWIEPGELRVSCLLDIPRDAVILAGLSAVIEESDGTKSYWALAHPPGKPDFHAPACFALSLPAPQAS
jgi:hypothetical protein